MEMSYSSSAHHLTSSRSNTPAKGAAAGPPKETLEASMFAPLGRSGALTLKSFGKNYLTDGK